MKNKFTLLFLSFCLAEVANLLGCSLKYDVNYQDESNVPEFVFTDANFNRYEDSKKTMSLKASRLEQYSDGKSMYAKDVAFSITNKEGEVTTEGSCSLLSSDSKDERYVLYDNIEIDNKKDDLKVSADTLRWDGKTEQLTSSRTDNVTIKKGKTTMQGSGFSASGVSKKFSFTGVVTGQFESEDENSTTSEENEESSEAPQNE